MSLITCHDCAGLGSAVKRVNRRKSGKISSVSFDLTKACLTCAGTGQAFVKRKVLYVGRPDLAKVAAPSVEA